MGCQNRHPHCHSQCEKYISAKHEYEEMKKRMRQEDPIREYSREQSIRIQKRIRWNS